LLVLTAASINLKWISLSYVVGKIPLKNPKIPSKAPALSNTLTQFGIFNF
jgi:hypothetical protein